MPLKFRDGTHFRDPLWWASGPTVVYDYKGNGLGFYESLTF